MYSKLCSKLFLIFRINRCFMFCFPSSLLLSLATLLALGLFLGCGRHAKLASLQQKAEQGDRESQYELGEAYRTGKGVPFDPVAAAKWLGKAAQQGHTTAQFEYGLLVLSGDGVDRDLVQAYKWESLATKGGNTNAPRYLNMLGQKLMPAQIAEGQKMADSFTPSGGGTP